MKTVVQYISYLAIVSIVLLAGCNLQTSLPATEALPGPVTVRPTGIPTTSPISTVEATVTATEEPVVLAEPDAGVTMLWSDSSYVVYVPGGEFLMGKNELAASDHSPAHTVTLGGYWIHQTEVTNSMYALCVNLGICSAPTHESSVPNWYTDPKYANAPVVGVNWNQAETYCEWIDARLPTEAEWEKAARGTDGASYPWGEDQPTCSLLNFKGCLLKPAPEIIRTYPQGASPYALADMAGNVYEWVFDRYAADYYASSPTSNPTGPVAGEMRVVRGSSYLTPAEDLNISLRNSLKPESERADLGFRCVLTGKTADEPTPPPAPVCTTLAFDLVIPVHQWAQYQAPPPPPVTLVTYCNLDNQNNQYGTASIWLDQTVDPQAVIISAQPGNLNCNKDILDPQKFNCSGSALTPGKSVTISVCYATPAQALSDPICPVFYHFDAATNLCKYGVLLPVQCAVPDVVIFGYGCLPAPQNGECPVGSYAATYNGKPVCIPASGPQCQNQLCPATCPAGLVFNQGNFCCDYPTDMQPTCRPGYSYDETFKLCTPDSPLQASCTNITTPVETCPTPPPPADCSSYQTQATCNTDSACGWVSYSAMPGGYCANK